MNRIFVNVSRGMTDKTAVCVFPWEKAILEQIHGGDVEEVSIDQMCDLKGPIKVEKIKFSRKIEDGKTQDNAPNLRAQLQEMIQVSEDDDPTKDPDMEYGRLVDKYGADKDINVPVVTRVYGEFNSGAFTAALKEAKRSGRKAAASTDKTVETMSINELRKALRSAGIEFDQTATKVELADLLATATA